LLPLAAALLLLGARTASAQLNVGWGDSPTNGAPTTYAYECKSDAGSSTLVFSYVSATDLVGVTAFLLDMTTTAGNGIACDPLPDGSGCVPPNLPAYWDLTPGTGCRSGAISASLDFSAAPYANSTLVSDPWHGAATLQVQPWVIQTKVGGANGYQQSYTVGRMQVVGSLPADSTVNLLAGHEYYLAAITIQNAKSAPGGCAGCCTSVRFDPVLNIAMANHSVVFMSQSLSGPALWQGADGSLVCATAPVRQRTWGSLKRAYR
jgi:hypothetical protein